MFAFAIREVIWHPSEHIRQFAIKIALRLENSATDESVQSAADFGLTFFEPQAGTISPEFLHEQFEEISLDFVVTGLAGKIAKKIQARFRQSHTERCARNTELGFVDKGYPEFD
jgi:hypothetical protein